MLDLDGSNCMWPTRFVLRHIKCVRLLRPNLVVLPDIARKISNMVWQNKSDNITDPTHQNKP